MLGGVNIRILESYPALRRKLTRTILFASVFALLPKSVALEDLAALLARQPGVSARAHKFVLASPLFNALHTATFSLPRPIGTGIPHPPVYALANFDPSDIAAPIGRQFLGDPTAPLQYPTVNRKDKADALMRRSRTPLPPLPPMLAIQPIPALGADAPFGRESAASRIDPYAQYEFASVTDDLSDDAANAGVDTEQAPVKSVTAATAPKHPLLGQDTARVYFNTEPLVSEEEEIRPWAPGYAPVVKNDLQGSDLELAALTTGSIPDDGSGGETIANKGEVTGLGQHPQSPAMRLGLIGPKRAKAEKCLANAVYFEARGEPVRGQIAVAQVVMNRVFSPFYPDNVCGVVYQNARHHLACQFTFACDGVPDVVTEPDAWARAKRIAHDMLNGELWLPQIAKSTHYHAYWVHPSWVREMRKVFKIGVHTFYRPRAWGDGSNEPSWGDPKTTARETKLIKKM